MYHNFSISKGDLGDFCSSPFLSTLFHPPLSFELTFVQRLQEEREGKKKTRGCCFGSTVIRSVRIPGWGQSGHQPCHQSTEVMAPFLQSQCSIQTHSAAVNFKAAAKTALLTSATPMKEQLLVVFWVEFQGCLFFSPLLEKPWPVITQQYK